MATIHKPRRHIEQFKGCLGFHATRGFSRAPESWDFRSYLHSGTECEALTKYRNCWGLHRSDYRYCQVRPKMFGPMTKEHRAWISHIKHGMFAEVAPARVEEAIIASAKVVSMAEGAGSGLLESDGEA